MLKPGLEQMALGEDSDSSCAEIAWSVAWASTVSVCHRAQSTIRPPTASMLTEESSSSSACTLRPAHNRGKADVGPVIRAPIPKSGPKSKSSITRPCWCAHEMAQPQSHDPPVDPGETQLFLFRVGALQSCLPHTSWESYLG